MIELLRRFKLFVTAAEIVKSTQIEGLREAGGNQTFAKLGCGRCYKPITQNGSWFCDRCLQIQDGCVICRETVKGRWTMCQVCFSFFIPYSNSRYWENQQLTLINRRAHTVDTTTAFGNGFLARRWTHARQSGAITIAYPGTTLTRNP